MAGTKGLTIAQAAEALGVSRMTIRRWIREGRIKAQLIDGNHGREYRILDLPSGYPPEAPENPLTAV